MTSIAANIVKRREQLGISQAELARLVGVSAATMSRWESGQSAPSRNNVLRLTAALQTTAASIHGDAEQPADIDAARLARAMESLEQALGQRFIVLSASNRAKLLAFVYSRGDGMSANEARALLLLVE